jgi:hypothetical protein
MLPGNTSASITQIRKGYSAQSNCRPQAQKDFTTEATEVTEDKRRQKVRVNKPRSRNPYPRKQ